MNKKLLFAALALAFTLPAEASVVAVFGNNSNANVTAFLNANGHTATNLGSLAPSAAQLVGVDAVIALRADGNLAVQNFVLGGGLLITEWFGAEWALDTANLLNADGGNNLQIGTGTPITITAAGLALGLGTGLSNPYSDGGRTEFQWTLSNIGSGVDILGTYGANVPAIIGGVSGSGYTLVNSLDWADGFPSGSSTSGTFLLNALNIQTGQVPEPAGLALLAAGLMGMGATRRRKEATAA